MNECNNRRRNRRRPAGEVDDSGFTLIELLVVIVVLGILAGIVVFALGGVSAQGDISACNTDSRTVNIVNIAVQAAITENPNTYPTDSGTWQTDLLSSSVLVGGPFLQNWPISTNGYSISVAGSGAAVDSGDTTTPANGDVVVTVSASGNTYDYTANPTTACATV
jgi:prepilin-type N-terminal cleavage/methylation domain-containing protein